MTATATPIRPTAPPPTTPAPATTPPPAAAGAVDPKETLRVRRRRIVGGLVLAVAIVLLDPFIGGIQHQQRQTHLVVGFGQPKPKIVPGNALVVLQIPSIELSEVVVEGSDSQRLRSGPGHVVGTSLPGAKGNTVIVGRSSRYGGPFSQLSTLSEGERIAVQSRSQHVQLYKVTSVKKIAEDDDRALEPTKDERLTLVTSDGGLLPSRRVVVTAEPDLEAAAPPAVPVKAPRYDPADDALDARPMDARALLLLLVLGVAAAAARRTVLRRYRPLTVAVVVTPAYVLAVVFLLHVADLIGPATW